MSSGAKIASARREPAEVMPRVGHGRCPLVLGECIQGRFGAGPHFLVTTPIDLHSTAEFEPRPEAAGVVVEPEQCSKSRVAVERFLEKHGLPGGGRLEIIRPLRPALGFGTSTADITSVLRAAAAAYSIPLEPEEISAIAVGIEPTDGSMHPGCVAYAHRQGRLLEDFGPMPRLRALVLLEGDGVETSTFDLERRDFLYSERDQETLSIGWEMVREAHRLGNVRPMAEAGVLSAKINQQLLVKPVLDEALDVFACVEASGLFIAHTGTLIAFVFDPDLPGFEKRWDGARRFLYERLPGEWIDVSSEGGGSRVGEPSHRPGLGARP